MTVCNGGDRDGQAGRETALRPREPDPRRLFDA